MGNQEKRTEVFQNNSNVCVRIKTIDYLKTVAIIGVLLYHTGWITNGYLGVEIFFVISGFLMMKSIKKDVEEGSFRPIVYILGRIADFLPLIAICGVISLGIGYYNMLPDDYENLAESIVASDFFANNILQAITTKNYWDIVNTYKPLMHTWYIGVLLQSYIFLVIIFWILSRFEKKDKTKTILIIVSVISFILFCLPFFSASDKFYYFPFRLFEITVGCLIPYMPVMELPQKTVGLLGNIGIVGILFLLFAGSTIVGNIGLVAVVLFSFLTIWTHASINEDYGISEKISGIITIPGRYSYDIYIWHQIVIAFLYYSLFQVLNAWLVIIVIAVTAVLSVISVQMRKRLAVFGSIRKKIIIAFGAVMIGCTLSMHIYLNAGVVRDVPELAIQKDNVHRNMHAEYVDIPYSWDNDFTDENKIHVLVLGNSFGRDFANILNESAYSEQIEISYIFDADGSEEKDRVEQADIVFYGASSWNIPKSLDAIPADKLYIVGNKEFGNSNGIIYRNRNKSWYFDQRAILSDDMILHNNAMRGVYGNHYIDMITPLLEENRIRVFTDDDYYISQDCRHLTKQGAMYYSRILDLAEIFDGNGVR